MFFLYRSPTTYYCAILDTISNSIGEAVYISLILETGACCYCFKGGGDKSHAAI